MMMPARALKLGSINIAPFRPQNSITALDAPQLSNNTIAHV